MPRGQESLRSASLGSSRSRELFWRTHATFGSLSEVMILQRIHLFGVSGIGVFGDGCAIRSLYEIDAGGAGPGLVPRVGQKI